MGDRSDERFGAAAAASALLIVFVSQLAPIQGFDVFWHLAIGDWIVEQRSVPRTGLFSATMGDRPWVDQEWGFQVVLSLVYRAFGWGGLVLLKAVLVTGALSILGACLRRRGLPWTVVAALIGLAWYGLDEPILRPQLVTYVFLAAFLLGTTALTDGRSRAPLVWLPGLAVLWANLHAGFMVGWVVLAVPTAVALGRRLLGRPANGPGAGRWLALSALTAAACLVNPSGWRQVWLPIEYLIRPAMTSFNLEWQPTELSHQPGLALLIALALATMIAGRRRLRVEDALLALAFAGFAMQAVRHVGLAALVLPVALAPCLAGPVAPALARMRRPVAAAAAATVVIALAGLYAARHDLPRRTPFRFADHILMPARSTDFLVRHRLAGPLLNQYGWGGYLIRRFSPDAVVYVDGRNDLYGEAFMAEYLALMAGEPGSVEVLDRRGVNAAQLAWHPNNFRLLTRLLEAGWVCVHRSVERGLPVVVLVRPTPATADLIERFGIELPAPG